MLVVTTNDLPGHRVVRVIGMVRGITVRSRSIVGTIGGALQSIIGGNITIFTSLAETARQEALDLMILHAEEAGANAIIGMRYDGNEITDGITEMLAYGTAVVVEPVP
ncbi:MAG: heavy metal-binding domain-containing protein [Devosia sp.]